MINSETLHEKLKDTGYLSSRDLDRALETAVNYGIPLLIEGDPGVGKTSVAKALSEALDMPLIRLQCYDGIDSTNVLYDLDYSSQLLTINMVRSLLNKKMEDLTIEEAMSEATTYKANLFTKEYLIPRPVLASITGAKRSILLIDEIDKAPEEVEHMLLQFLDSFEVTVPEIGTFQAEEGKEPVVILTSNAYRELSDTLKRRCAYLYLDSHSRNELREILALRTAADEKLCEHVATVLAKLRDIALDKTPSIAEGVQWTKYLESHDDDGVFLLAKTKKDRQKIRKILGDLPKPNLSEDIEC